MNMNSELYDVRVVSPDLTLENFLKLLPLLLPYVSFLNTVDRGPLIRFGRLREDYEETMFEIIDDDNYQQIRLRSLDPARVNMASLRSLIRSYYEALLYHVSDFDNSDSDSHVLMFVNTSTSCDKVFVQIDRLLNDLFMIQVY